MGGNYLPSIYLCEISPILNMSLEKNPLKEPDASLLILLQQTQPDLFTIKANNGRIIELHIKFSPGLLPRNITSLTYLEIITTEYTFETKENGYLRTFYPNNVLSIPDALKTSLRDDEIRGIELWKSEYDAMNWLLSDQYIDVPTLLFDDDLAGFFSDPVLGIRNGHITILQIIFVNEDEIEKAKIPLMKLTNLEYLEIRDYQVNLEMMEGFEEPDWLKQVAKVVEFDYDY